MVSSRNQGLAIPQIIANDSDAQIVSAKRHFILIYTCYMRVSLLTTIIILLYAVIFTGFGVGVNSLLADCCVFSPRLQEQAFDHI